MILFRHADSRFPFLWETADQPPARWHGIGEGPVHYFAETADAAWAEFLRHEGIADADDLAGVARSLWAISVPAPPRVRPILPTAIATGGVASYEACQVEARRLRARGVRGISALSAAVDPRMPSGYRTHGGLRPGPRRRERVIVLFGARPELIGWAACAEGRPRDDLLKRIRPLTA